MAAGQYLTVVEKCHNALEKLLKGILVEKNKPVRKIHDLLVLATEAVVGNLKVEIANTFDELNDYYIHTRYPDDFARMILEVSQPKAEAIYNKTKDTFKWLEKSMQN